MKLKLPVVLVTLIASLCVAAAQEKLPAEKVQAAAHKLVGTLGDVSGAQVRIEANADKGDAFTVHELAALVLPDKNLTAAVLDKGGAAIIPLGELFLKGLSPVKNGSATPTDQLRTLMFTDNGGEQRIAVLLLGIRRQEEKLELVVYGKDESPLLLLPVPKADNPAQDLPLELTGEKQDDDTGRMTLNILGKYKATILVKKAEG